MKFKITFFFLLIFIDFLLPADKKPFNIIYIHPSPGSEYIPVQSSIILKINREYQSQLSSSLFHFEVLGEKSGSHAGSVIISGNTVIFDPEENFKASELVKVSVQSQLINNGNEFEFSFHTSSIEVYNPEVFKSVSDEPNQLTKQNEQSEVYGKTTTLNGVTVPADFPKMNVSVSGETAPGKIFIANWGGVSHMMILENDGTPYFYKRFPNSNQTRDFKVQPGGQLTRRVYESLHCFVEMDSQYVDIDTMRCGNGYGTDEHECIMLPDGHYFLIALDYQTVDMSQVVPGGQTNAMVIGNHVQELDENDNVVFEWRSWDNFDIEDAVHENLSNYQIDYVHINSIAIDYDSNIVISSRHLSEVTKINRNTGEIIWRFGGENNQFTLVDDDYGISYQHDTKPVPGKPDHYTIFDNGNYHSPNFSRAVEFKIDTAAMTATKVWEYRHSPDYITYWMGSVQRLENGNTFIDWADNALPKAFEVTPSGEIVYQANFQHNYLCYRAFRFDWESVVKVPYLIAESYSYKVKLIFNKFGDKKVEKYIIYGGLSPNPETPLDSTSGTFIDLVNLDNNSRYYFRVTARDSSGIESPFSNEESVIVNFIPAGENFIVNGDFSHGTNNWILNLQNNGQAQGSAADGEYFINIDNGGTHYYDVQLIQESFLLIHGKRYIFEFDARADSNRIMEPRVTQNGGGIVYSRTGIVPITPQVKHFKYEFEMTDPTDFNARVVLNFGTSAINCYVDNISLKEAIPNSVDDYSSLLPDNFMLYPNYPNPFNPSTIISYQLAPSAENYFVTITIFDILGRKTAGLVSGEKAAGKHTIQWDASACAGGIYFCELKVLDSNGFQVFNKVNKIVYLK